MNGIQRIKRYLAINFSFKKNQTDRIISFWEKGGADFEYFQSAEREEWLEIFWNEKGPFLPLFNKLTLDVTLEIACGTGRHSARAVDQTKRLYLLDSSAGALDIAKERFAAHNHVSFMLNKSGYGIPDIENETLTAVFSYDAMVHFEKECLFSYIKDSYRVLKPGGQALFHHSNYDKNPRGKFTDNPGWRNFMTQELFTRYAKDCGFEVIQSKVFSFSCPDSDCITLLGKA